jgi:hypothetical protein
MVIFGAGASYDSVAARTPVAYPRYQYLGQDVFSRPPLAKELFLPEGLFADSLDYFPECRPIIPYLRAADNLEHTLETLQNEAEADLERLRQIAAIRYYLQNVITQCGNQWQNVARGMTNYVTLLDQLRRCRLEDPVLLVTFNYDKMIEDALSSVGVAVNDISQYISHGAFKLFKLHGSVDWGREVETEISNLPNRDKMDIVRELIKRAGELKISDRYILAGGQPISNIGNIPLFPAIAIPVETKSGFECPSDHLECLSAHLGKVTKIIIVGWRATEKHFLDLLSGAVTGNIPVQVIAGGRDPGEEVLSHFSTAGISILGEALDAGFTQYVVSREAERFLKM